LKYAEELTCEMKLLDEEAVEDCLNVDPDAPVVLQLIDSEIVDIILHPDSGSNTDYDHNEVFSEEEKFKLINVSV
jgi:hypothetical protein